MGDSSACLMQPFCYASGTAKEANESNPIHALGQSVSFGRFMSESLAWDKWSTFSQNRYVEEAERFSRPGSVAQKKAFFEAHYKKLAAQKAAALLEQAKNATQTELEHEAVVDYTHDLQITSPKSDVVFNEGNTKILESQPDAMLRSTGYDSNSNIETSLSNKEEGAQMKHQFYEGNSILETLQNQLQDVDSRKQGFDSKGEILQSTGQKPPVSSFKLFKVIGTSKFTSTPVKSTDPAFSNEDNIATSMSNKPSLSSADKKRSTPKSLHMSLNFTPIREINRLTESVTRKFKSTRIGAGSSHSSKDSSTPLRTSSVASKKELQQHSSLNPSTENKRNKMAPPIISSPFSLRTEERAASRKKKLEENFNANEAQNVLLHTTFKNKAKKKIRKLRHSCCFTARPLPDFYSEREASKRETKKDQLTHREASEQGRSPTKRSLANNNGIKNFHGNNSGTLTLPLTSNSIMIATHENTSPNIQDGNQNDRNYQ